MPATEKGIPRFFASWWRSVDRYCLIVLLTIMIGGFFLIVAASPAVALRIGGTRLMFISKQAAFLVLGSLCVIGISALPRNAFKWVAWIVGAVALALTGWTLFHGLDMTGAKRWVALPFMSLQPSEFLKPCFAVVCAWLLTQSYVTKKKFLYRSVAIGIFLLIALLLFLQPDIGMLTVITFIGVAIAFADGLPVILLLLVGGSLIPLAFALYEFLPHVHSRVERFLHADKGDHYQVTTARHAFANGGFLGRGPGEGRFKDTIPDAHADFIFAVGAEEYGLLFCLLVIGGFLFIALRSLRLLREEGNYFFMLAGTGLVTAFACQAFINMASTVQLIPTKGMTLPFMSYGGSSVLAIALTVGLLLGLTRNRLPYDK